MFTTKRRRAAEAREANRERAEREARDNSERLDYAKIHLDELGYEAHETEDELFGGIEVAWKLTERQREANEAESQARAEALAKAIDDARADERRITLATVIDALELTSYRRVKLGHAHASAHGILGPIYKDGPFVSSNPIDTDGFWADLQTTLELRDERTTTAAREAAEARVSGLTAPPAPRHIHIHGAQLADAVASAARQHVAFVPAADINPETVTVRDLADANAFEPKGASIDFDMADCG